MTGRGSGSGVFVPKSIPHARLTNSHQHGNKKKGFKNVLFHGILLQENCDKSPHSLHCGVDESIAQRQSERVKGAIIIPLGESEINRSTIHCGWMRWRWRESNIIPLGDPVRIQKQNAPGKGASVEMAGIEPASERIDPRKSTSVAGRRWSPQASRPARIACGQPLCLLHG